MMFCAIDVDTKLVPAFRVGDRDAITANAFLMDVAGRMANRVQISTDGLQAYKEAIERSFGGDADYGQIVKTYGLQNWSTIAGIGSRISYRLKRRSFTVSQTVT
jgi:transposase-like protein